MLHYSVLNLSNLFDLITVPLLTIESSLSDTSIVDKEICPTESSDGKKIF